MTSDLTTPCGKCGTTERDKLGRCRRCWRAAYDARVLPEPRSLADRLWEKVDKNGPIIRPDLGPCWVFTGKLSVTGGYGIIWFEGKEVRVHRAAFLIEHGRWPLPMGLHHCDNPPCCKAKPDEHGPAHIYEGDGFDNGRDMGSRGRARLQKHPEMARRELSPRHILTEANVADIRQRYEAGGVRQADLAAEFGVTQAAISLIITRRNWR
jgi:hypothetical protein